jgi:hypothetical protein
MLTRYWITFVPSDELLSYSLGLGAGVTAFDDTDAIRLLEGAFGNEGLPPIKSISAGVRFDDLERDNVQKNLGNMGVRGVWYPNCNR